MGWIALVFAAGIATGTALGPDLPIAVPLSVAAGATALALRRSRARYAWFAVAILSFGTSIALCPAEFPSWLLTRTSGLREITGTVVSYPEWGGNRVRFVLRPESLPGRVLVDWRRADSDPPDLFYGDRVVVSGTARLPEVFDGFDYPSYLHRQGIFATVFAESCVVTGVSTGWLRAGDVLRQRLLERLSDRLSASELALAQSLFFGDRSALDDEVETAFSRSGMMHLLAVSGLHLGILLAGFWFVLRRLGLRPAVSYPVVACVALAFLWLVGPRVSLLRASLLFCFLASGSVLADLGWILRRSIRPLDGLAAAAILLLILRPSSLLDVGFQLTFAATWALLWIGRMPRWKAARERWSLRHAARCRWPLRRGGELLLVSLSAQAGAAPVIALHFGALHPWSALAGLAAIPLAAASLWFGLLTVLLSSVPVLGQVTARTLGGCLAALTWAIGTFGALPGSEIAVSPVLGVWMIGATLFLLLGANYSSSVDSSRTSNSTSITLGSGPSPRVDGRP
jgi:competence protein ComEC